MTFPPLVVFIFAPLPLALRRRNERSAAAVASGDLAERREGGRRGRGERRRDGVRVDVTCALRRTSGSDPLAGSTYSSGGAGDNESIVDVRSIGVRDSDRL
jgi:hypothetical protein